MQQPCYQALRETPASLGAHIIDWRPALGWDFGLDALPDGAARASAIFLNSPHGPSGSMIGGRYAGPARLVADEVYRPITLVPRHRARSVLERGDASVSISDLSKPLGLGGLRIGWLATHDRALLASCARVLDYHSGSVSKLSALVAAAALSRFDELLEPHLRRARANLSLLAAFVEQHEAWFDWTPPQAGYTALLRFRAGAAPPALHAALRDRGVFALDGAVFDAPDHVRIGFGLDTPGFAEALGLFGDEVRRHIAPSPVPTPHGDVIVLAKEPRAGYTKTRLAAVVSSARGAELSAAFLRDTLAFAALRGRRLYIAYAPEDARDAFHTLAPDALAFAQPAGDLGARLSHAFETVIREGGLRPVLIGSDSPTLPAHLLAAAHAALMTHDVVLGPAEDGGYYLIGMNAPHVSLFSGIRWSSDAVLEQTLARAAEARLRVFVLPYWYDIDTASDLDRLQRDPLLRAESRRALAIGALAGAAAS
ncbi:MAG: TIGR04282 family arsenosugar biosynthesis glycosyltransferase [Dehalococcoidia bacterium]|nr:TIGR04282 family arsenosugar biosynthesis glycosyltransferase [Dehalococcoidia bacterium]